MPIHFGRIYPEIGSAGFPNRCFRVLLINPENFPEGAGSLDAISHLLLLKKYLRSLSELSLDIEIYLYSARANDYAIADLIMVDYTGNIDANSEAIVSIAARISADFVVMAEPGRLFPKRYDDNEYHMFGDIHTAMRELEYFARGHDIPWSYDRPIWNMPWTTFYAMADDYAGQLAKEYFPKYDALIANPKTKELLRSLVLNRYPLLWYTRDKLHYLVQQRLHARRRGWTRQRFKFEASYYLNHYYLLLWGGIDQISLIIRDTLGLCVSDRRTISISNDRFVETIKSIDTALGSIYEESWYLDWMRKLRTMRHHLAHRGTIILSDMLEKPKNEYPEDELRREAMERADSRLMASTLSEEQFKAYIAMAMNTLRFQKMKRIRDDSMTVDDGDSSYVNFPLIDIDWNLDNYDKTITKSLDALGVFLKTRSGSR